MQDAHLGGLERKVKDNALKKKKNLFRKNLIL